MADIYNINVIDVFDSLKDAHHENYIYICRL